MAQIIFIGYPAEAYLLLKTFSNYKYVQVFNAATELTYKLMAAGKLLVSPRRDIKEVEKEMQ
jgi:hypothetical protein